MRKLIGRTTRAGHSVGIGATPPIAKRSALTVDVDARVTLSATPLNAQIAIARNGRIQMTDKATQGKPRQHTVEIFGNRPGDNSLIYYCTRCRKSGIGLIGSCGVASGPRGRRRKVRR